MTRQTNTRHHAAWTALLMGGFFYCYQFIIRVSPDVMQDELMQSFSVDMEGLTSILKWYYLGYAMLQVPLGLLMDRFGPRRIIAAGALVCSASTILFSMANTPHLASLSRFLIGLGSACGYLGALKLGSQWFARPRMPMVVAVVMAMGTIGASFGLFPLEFLVSTIGWQGSLEIISFGGMIIAASMIFLVGKNPHYHEPHPNDQHFLQDLMYIVKNRQAWLIAVYAMLMYMPLTLIGDAMGVSFLESKYNVLESDATAPVTFMFIGVAVGSPVFAYLTHALKSRIKPMMIGALATSLIYFAVVFAPPAPFIVLCVMMFLAGFLFNGQTLAFTAICEIMPLHASGVAVGFVNMIVMLNGFIFLPVVGRVMAFFWDGRIVDGIPIYATFDYQWGLALIPASLLISIFLAKSIRETYHIHQEK